MPAPATKNRRAVAPRNRITLRNKKRADYYRAIGGGNKPATAKPASGGLRPPSVGVPQWDLFRGIGDAITRATGGRAANRRSAPMRPPNRPR